MQEPGPVIVDEGLQMAQQRQITRAGAEKQFMCVEEIEIAKLILMNDNLIYE